MKRPYLVYLFTNQPVRAARPIDDDVKLKHRAEIARFAEAVAGAEVGFGAISYREWLDSWPDSDIELARDRTAIV